MSGSSSSSASDSDSSSASLHSDYSSSTSILASTATSSETSKSTSQSHTREIEVPFADQVQLSWKDISYEVRDRGTGEQRLLLDKVSGYANPGSLTAIIGPSGAGKTSLIRILGRTLGDTTGVSGDVMVNGSSDLSYQDYMKITAFVAQDDVLMGSATVRECFEFAASLRLPSTMTKADKKGRVDDVITTLGLDKCQHTLCGFTGPAAANSGLKRGISGGERKRTSIGLELITNPRLLLLDEPTSGLDSYAAKSAMIHLGRLARRGHTILCTIHQPSNQIFRLFDNLIVLAEGRTLYSGPAREALPYFASQGFKCPPFRNPADYIMRSLFTGVRDDIEANQQLLEHVDDGQVARFAECYQESPYARQALSPPGDYPPLQSHRLPQEHKASVITQFWVLLLRSIRNNLREPLLLWARLFNAVVLALMVGAVFWNVGDDQAGILDTLGGITFVVEVMVFDAMNGPMYLFPAERAVFYRENSSDLYSTSVYFASKIFADVPINTVAPILFSSICYYMIGLAPSFTKFAVFCGVMILIAQVSYGLGMVLICAFKSQAVALTMETVALLPLFLFSGLYLNSDSVPEYLIWVETISPLKYALHAAAINEFTDATYTCSPAELANTNGTCPLTTGAAVIDSFGMTDLKVSEHCSVLLGMWGGLSVISYLFLRFRARE